MNPILFSTDMVRAILDGRKTMTRRLIQPQPPADAEIEFKNGMEAAIDKKADLWNGRRHNFIPQRLPYRIRDGHGDILYVRETWKVTGYDSMDGNLGVEIEFKADGKRKYFELDDEELFHRIGKSDKWRPSIHMPKEAARIFLKVTAASAERLQDITEEEALQEGFSAKIKSTESLEGNIFLSTTSARENFIKYWDKRYAKRGYGWDDNPWVWVYGLEKIENLEEEK